MGRLQNTNLQNNEQPKMRIYSSKTPKAGQSHICLCKTFTGEFCEGEGSRKTGKMGVL